MWTRKERELVVGGNKSLYSLFNFPRGEDCPGFVCGGRGRGEWGEEKGQVYHDGKRVIAEIVIVKEGRVGWGGDKGWWWGKGGNKTEDWGWDFEYKWLKRPIRDEEQVENSLRTTISRDLAEVGERKVGRERRGQVAKSGWRGVKEEKPKTEKRKKGKRMVLVLGRGGVGGWEAGHAHWLREMMVFVDFLLEHNQLNLVSSPLLQASKRMVQGSSRRNEKREEKGSGLGEENRVSKKRKDWDTRVRSVIENLVEVSKAIGKGNIKERIVGWLDGGVGEVGATCHAGSNYFVYGLFRSFLTAHLPAPIPLSKRKKILFLVGEEGIGNEREVMGRVREAFRFGTRKGGVEYPPLEVVEWGSEMTQQQADRYFSFFFFYFVIIQFDFF